MSAALASNEGAALKSYITDTDALNLTTHGVLANGRAAALDKGLKQFGTLASSLDTLLADLIPETASAGYPCSAPANRPHVKGCVGSMDGGKNGSTTASR